MRWREVAVLGAFYMSWTVRRGVGGGGRPAGGECGFKSFCFEVEKRGRGVGLVPLDEGNGGGTGGASPPLPSGTGGRPTVVHVMAACQAAAAAVNRGGGRVGVAWAGMLLWAGPA
jgi:hypothetical protein